MQELYISPELNVICFAPVERLANSDDLLEIGPVSTFNTYGGRESGVDVEDDDFGMDI